MKKNTFYIKKNRNKLAFEYFIFITKNNIFGYVTEIPFFSKNSTVRCTISELYDIIKPINLKARYDFRRYSMSNFEKIKISEEEESFSNDDLFNINSWGADLSFRELISMYDEEDLIKPELQRKYVWKIEEASRLIDSILLGLPIPSIFLAKKDEKRLIIDGYQRIKTVYDYVNGIFSKNGRTFKLSNSKIINERWRGKTFLELS